MSRNHQRKEVYIIIAKSRERERERERMQVRIEDKQEVTVDGLVYVLG